MSFSKDLALGQIYEKKLVEIMKFKDYEIMQGKFKEYDIIVKDNKIRRYEVKCDRLAIKTGNICIEYKCNGVLSGISTTTSHYYAYFILNGEDYELYIIPTSRIIKNIDRCLYNRRISGGDNYKSQFYLFSKNVFKDYKINL
jgi:hypothetical protein